MIYYNEFDPKAAAWLRELCKQGLIPEGQVDERSIATVRADDCAPTSHFFAGIGGWAEALRLADWPADRPVWTGSCPCQPFSNAGKRKGEKDARDLWPQFFRLIQECRPPFIFGEQVASAEVVGTELEAAFIVAVQQGDFARANKLAKRLAQSGGFHYTPRWIDRVQADLEREGYTFRFDVLGAHSAGAPHIRQRVYWGAVSVADTTGARRRRRENAGTGFGNAGEGARRVEPERSGHVGGECNPECAGREGDSIGGISRQQPAAPSGIGGTVDTQRAGLEGFTGHGADRDQPGRKRTEATGPTAASDGAGAGTIQHAQGEGRQQRRAESGERGIVGGCGESNFWSAFDILQFSDGKARRVEPGTFPLAHGVPARVVRLRGYGNAIVPQVAAGFVKAFMNSLGPA